MEKMRNILWNVFFFGRSISSLSQLNRFYLKKEKSIYANDWLELSLRVIIMVYIFSLRKRFYCTYLKATEHVMIFSHAKPFNEKMCEKLVKIWKESKKHVSVFSTLSINDMKTKKNTNLFCRYKNIQK